MAKEARLLLEGVAPARAFALALLASEEAAKAMLAIEAARHPEDDADYWTFFWNAFYAHRTKLSGVLGLIADDVDERTGFVLQDLVEEFAKVLDRDKQAALYVDVVRSEGEWQIKTPGQAVDHDRAVYIVDRYGTLVERLAERLDEGGARRLMARLRSARLEGLPGSP